MKVTIDIPDDRIANLLCSAFEGGSNYWYRIDEFIAPPAGNLFKMDDDPAVYRHIQYPLSVGGALIVSDFKAAWEESDTCKTCGKSSDDEGHTDDCDDEDDDPRERHDFIPSGMRTERLDRESIARGLAVMVEKYGQHFGAFMSENDDAITGDVFLQCCLYGELIYG